MPGEWAFNAHCAPRPRPPAGYKVIVFFTTARLTQYMASLVAAAGMPVLEIHSRKSQVRVRRRRRCGAGAGGGGGGGGGARTCPLQCVLVCTDSPPPPRSHTPQGARDKAAAEFRGATGGCILFSSDVSARGVDYPDVTLVLQVGGVGWW